MEHCIEIRVHIFDTKSNELTDCVLRIHITIFSIVCTEELKRSDDRAMSRRRRSRAFNFVDRSFAFRVRWHRDRTLYHNLRREVSRRPTLLSPRSSVLFQFASVVRSTRNTARGHVPAIRSEYMPRVIQRHTMSSSSSLSSHRDERFRLPEEFVSEPRRGRGRCGRRGRRCRRHCRR